MMIPVGLIQGVVADEFGIPSAKMIERLDCFGRDGRNAWEFSHPRQVAMYLTKKLTRYSYPQIGQRFGGRDHSTVFHAVKVVRRRLESDADLRARVNSLIERLQSMSIPLFSFRQQDKPIQRVEPAKILPPPKTDWRAAEEAEEKRRAAVQHDLMRGQASEPKVRIEDRVYRDPCIKCGVRGDIGCVHTRVAA
jgi:hypothetical protein